MANEEIQWLMPILAINEEANLGYSGVINTIG